MVCFKYMFYMYDIYHAGIGERKKRSKKECAEENRVEPDGALALSGGREKAESRIYKAGKGVCKSGMEVKKESRSSDIPERRTESRETGKDNDHSNLKKECEVKSSRKGNCKKEAGEKRERMCFWSEKTRE